jgi:SPX domain protein involved in polyphosphate accumulation
MAINVFRRYEKKFIMDAAAMDRLLTTVREHMDPDKYCVNGRTYHICNLYFDTEQDDVIRESLQHPFYKEKLRMRSYGLPQSGEDSVFLELKKKVNRIVTKRRTKLSYAQAAAFLREATVPEGADYMQRQVLSEIDYYLSHKDVGPTTLISYDRMAFFDRTDPNFRLTFDSNLRHLRGVQTFLGGQEGELLFPPDFRLMEVKVSNAYPLWFARLLSEQNVHPHSFSKYGVAYKTWLKTQLDREDIDVLGHI